MKDYCTWEKCSHTFMVGGFHPRHTVGNYTSLGSSFAIHSFYSLLRSSLAHGIPPPIPKDQFDVPVPTVRNLLSTGQESEKRTGAVELFIQLYSLVQILGDILPLIYDLRFDYKGAWKKIRRLECSLDDWETSLPEHLRVHIRDGVTLVSGFNRLYFNFLSTRLLCRVPLR
jgi:hypothetical protein